MVLHNLLKTASFIPDLTVKLVGTAHWPHLEKPEEFNRIVRGWLEERFRPRGIEEKEVRHGDEL